MKKMKKNFLCIGAIAIVALAVLNLNLTYNKEAKVNVGLTRMLAVAQSEGDGGGCFTVAFITRDPNNTCWFTVEYICGTGGDDSYCESGFEVNNECPPSYDMWHNVQSHNCY